jgi:NAD(P)-dependent dehydrogenase (short-subunit alcohol dehydrogenase family)
MDTYGKALKRTALVTGGNRGIGLAIVKSLAEAHGMTVLLGCRDLSTGRSAAAGINGTVLPVEIDAGTDDKLRRQISVLEATHPAIDVLVNNAGVYPPGDVLEVTWPDLTEAIQVNVMGPWRLIKALTPGMVERGYGRIVNVSSGGGSFGEGLFPDHAAYGASKAALNALTMQLAQTLPRAVKANALCPGWVRTRMGGAAAPRSPEEGADTAVWLATLPEDGPTGGFFRDRKPIEW